MFEIHQTLGIGRYNQGAIFIEINTEGISNNDSFIGAGA